MIEHEVTPEPRKTHAQQNIDFAFVYDWMPDPTGEQAVAADELVTAIKSLQTLPHNSGFTWSQGYWLQKPGDTVNGFATVHSHDDSKLFINISSKPVAMQQNENALALFRNDPLFISFTTESKDQDPSKIISVQYRVERDKSTVLCITDKEYGQKISDTLKFVDLLDIDYDSDVSVNELLGALLLEGTLLGAGLDSQVDPDLEQLREDVPIIKAISDRERNLFANESLEKQLGLKKGERVVSIDEVRLLIRLLESI